MVGSDRKVDRLELTLNIIVDDLKSVVLPLCRVDDGTGSVPES